VVPGIGHSRSIVRNVNLAAVRTVSAFSQDKAGS
jgi:hypothetical protein